MTRKPDLQDATSRLILLSVDSLQNIIISQMRIETSMCESDTIGCGVAQVLWCHRCCGTIHRWPSYSDDKYCNAHIYRKCGYRSYSWIIYQGININKCQLTKYPSKSILLASKFLITNFGVRIDGTVTWNPHMHQAIIGNGY